MSIFDRNTRGIYPKTYPDYKPIDPDKLHLRRISDEEYEALPGSSKSRFRLLFPSVEGLLFVGVLIFSFGMISTSAKDLADHKYDAGMFMFISLMLTLFGVSISLMMVNLRLNRYVSRDSLVTAGEITRMTEVRGSRNALVGYDCVIALHGRKEIVTIRDKCHVRTGSTVLIVKTRSLEYCLHEIPSQAAAYDSEAPDFSEEIISGSELFTGDYSDYEKISVFNAHRHDVVGEEYRGLPAKYRNPSPFSHGLLSVCWAVSTAALAAVILLMPAAKRSGNDNLFVIMIVSIICLLLLVYTFSSMAFKRLLPRNKTYCIECIPVKKIKNMGRCFISVIIPARRHYIDNVVVDPSVFDSVRINEEQELYFSTEMPIVRYVRSRYEKY